MFTPTLHQWTSLGALTSNVGLGLPALVLMTSEDLPECRGEEAAETGLVASRGQQEQRLG